MYYDKNNLPDLIERCSEIQWRTWGHLEIKDLKLKGNPSTYDHVIIRIEVQTGTCFLTIWETKESQEAIARIARAKNVLGKYLESCQDLFNDFIQESDQTTK